MPEDWEGPPAAQGLPDRRRAGPLLGRRAMSTTADTSETTRARASRRGCRRCSKSPRSCGRARSSPGQLRPEPPVDARRAPPHRRPPRRGGRRRVSAVIGYLHTGFEKTMESKTYWKGVTYPERIDYVGYQNNELVFVLAVEQLLELEVPTKAKWMRMLLCELNRIHSHLVFLGTSALELGAISMFWYCFRERETILDLFELVTGQRMHTRYFQVGGLAEDIPQGFYPECREVRRVDAARARRLQGAPRPERDLARADAGRRRPLGLRRDRARADRPQPARLGRRLGPAPRPAVPPLRAGRLPRAGLPRGRRLRPLPRADGRDGGVDEHRAPVPRPARAHGRDAVDRRRPQGRAAAARRAPHLDGVAHPPLQDRDRGLPRARRRDLRRGRVAARRVRVLPRLGRRPEAVAHPLPRTVVRRARGDGDVPPPTRSSPT